MTEEDDQLVIEGGVSVDASISELAEVGITLALSKTNSLQDMEFKRKRLLFANLCLPPLSLDSALAILLVNMAAYELCSNSNFMEAQAEASAVCSYLQLLTTLVRREEDVRELRRKRILMGAGLIDKEAFDFFCGIQGLRLGTNYVRVMDQIACFVPRTPMRTKVHALVYRNGKTVVTVLSAIGALVGILKALQPLFMRS